MGALYQGQIMEAGPAEDVYQHPIHPYTQALIAAELVPYPEARRRVFPPRRDAGAGSRRRSCPRVSVCASLPRRPSDLQGGAAGDDASFERWLRRMPPPVVPTSSAWAGLTTTAPALKHAVEAR